MQIRGNFDLLKLAIASDDFGFCNFDEVVVLGGNPENGNRFRVALSQTSSQLHRRDSFVDRVEWTSEQSRLLT